MSDSGDRLFVTNTPDSRIEIFDLSGKYPRLIDHVIVGLEPTAIAVRNSTEIWVVNHLSDSVSIVDISQKPARVMRTLLVGDEPRDIVFAGANNDRAFITTAHRGQNSPYRSKDNPGELTTASIGRTDVWVFDTANPGASPAGSPIAIMAFFGDSPGPLAVSPDRQTVYAGVFKSGNQTTIVGRVLVCPGGNDAEPCEIYPGGPLAPGGLPAPNANAEGVPMPEAGLVVQWDGKGWKDELDRDWSSVIRLDLPDYDVFAIDALAETPDQLAVYPGVGTILYAMAVNPANNKLYVANTEARNKVRFEGPRKPESNISTVMGHLHESRLTVIDPENASIIPRHLNKHIDYRQLVAPKQVRKKSLSMPVGLTFTADGKTLYLAAKGSDKIAILNTREIERDTFTPSQRDHISIPGGGPAGLVLDEARSRLYVLTRFDNALAVIDTNRRKVIHRKALLNPEPESVTAGRPFFYNALITSSNGESSCASCHVAGDKDELSWDLGDPADAMMTNPSPVVGPLRGMKDFHPMKGPMLTQTMRGIDAHGPLHWRGDRTAGNDPDGDPQDTAAAMLKFNAAFVTLLGRAEVLSDADMQKLTDFSLQIMPPPNPIRSLDDSLTPMQAAGKAFFTRAPSVMGRASCASCHPVSSEQNIFGTTGLTTNVIGGRPFKIPSHRNTYERVGMFGRAPTRSIPQNGKHMGPQIRGYGFTHDGGADTVIRFASYPVFKYQQPALERRQIEQYLFAFESNLKPVVGQQITLNDQAHERVIGRIGLLADRSVAGDADLIATGVVAGERRGYLLMATGKFRSDRADEPALEGDALLELAKKPGNSLTFTATPKGSGFRMSVDRDMDGTLNSDSM